MRGHQLPLALRATFHMCKEDEHMLLCPNEKVPCINANYGCPFTMCRSKLAKHLEGKYRRSVPRQHRHCESCYSKRCRAPLEVSVSCMVINCRLLCGATFHMCKEDEHMLLCPNEKVPCINANYGCPFTMCRSKLAKHLEVCPASVVCCSMEWNRWPVEDVKSPFYINLLKDVQEPQPLDLSMALRDQKHICARLKMRTFFPEIMEELEEPIVTEQEEEEEEEGAAGGEDLFNGHHVPVNGIKDESKVSMKGPVNAAVEEEPVEKDFKDLSVNKEKYNLYEKMFSMEKGGCQQAGNEGSKTGDKEEKRAPPKGSTNQAALEQQQKGTSKEAGKGCDGRDAAQPDISKTGLAPWQEGVLERLGREVNPREFNMYIVHHGRMLLSFGQIEACTPREKDFVYGSLEPIPVQTLHSFNVPISYRYKRIQLKDPSTRAQTVHKSVDTSDLPKGDTPKMDEMFATLLCAAEVEIRGHKVSETVGTDGLYVDIATQTYDFATAPFKYNATLADITAERDLTVHLQTDTESVTLRHNKSTSAFTFLCGHFFRRDEFASHFRNVHSDIQSCLNGWFEQRCPLAYLGCTFVQKRLQPSTHRATASYNQDLSIFTLRPEIPASLMDSSQTVTMKQMRAKQEDTLSSLPFEVLRHIASYLDSFSLSQLALVSRRFRDVSATLLQERGMVGFKWRKKIYSHGRARWKSSVVWEFSSLFSRVDSWRIDGAPSMAEHLKCCPYYQMEPKTRRVALPSMQNHKEDSEERQSLVRQKTPASKLHRHCESCHSRRCRAPIEISVSCMIIKCRLLCGATFHMCKEDEHMLLCPNEKVPCINANYGCPFTMCRSKLAKHLEVCPASVVCCSMEWNRWPIEEAEPPEFYQNILKQDYTQEPLDLSMALRDQRYLFQSLKMKAIFPELIEKVEEEPEVQELEGAVGGVLNDVAEGSAYVDANLVDAEFQERPLTQEEREALARDTNVTDLGRYNIWEKMFSMELSGCKHTIKSLGTNPPPNGNELKSQAHSNSLEILPEESLKHSTEVSAPLERPDFNPFEMDERKFLIATSLFACDTRPTKKFIYERLEPMKIKTVKTFKIPTSFKARPSNIRNPSRYKRVSKSVDTSDLDIDMDDIPKWDEVQATLLCSLEKERRGHLIAEAGSSDALLINEGTQTYDFYSIPFKADATLADITAERALQLHVQIHTESVTNKHNKSSSAFTYLCCHSFRRDEFPSHFRNVHSDIQTNLNGWFEQRCPLAYLGCTFIQRRFQPSTHRAVVSYDKDLSTFSIRPEVPAALYEVSSSKIVMTENQDFPGNSQAEMGLARTGKERRESQ
ncbi:hypothetical protein NFI96_002540, partial [Prochilodus magdalenae]